MSRVETTDGVEKEAGEVSSPPLLLVQGLGQNFRVRTSARGSRRVSIIEDIGFDIAVGESVALVGESGSGKSTIVRAVLGSPPPSKGRVFFEGAELGGRNKGRSVGLQAIFQDPYGSVDPTWTVGRVVAEPIRRECSRLEVQERVETALARVGLADPAFARRRPRELSGGQCQRVAIARAIVGNPKLIVCDEPVASLDVSVQAQVLNLFNQLRQQIRLSYLFVTHDLNVAHFISDRVVVVYLGRVCEIGASQRVWRAPAHPYTKALLEASPAIGRMATGANRKKQEWPSVLDPPSGCRFRTRCPRATDRCREEVPVLREVGPGSFVACHFPLEAS